MGVERDIGAASAGEMLEVRKNVPAGFSTSWTMELAVQRRDLCCAARRWTSIRRMRPCAIVLRKISVRHAGQTEVIDVFGAAGDIGAGFKPRNVLADLKHEPAETGFLSFSGGGTP